MDARKHQRRADQRLLLHPGPSQMIGRVPLVRRSRRFSHRELHLSTTTSPVKLKPIQIHRCSSSCGGPRRTTPPSPPPRPFSSCWRLERDQRPPEAWSSKTGCHLYTRGWISHIHTHTHTNNIVSINTPEDSVDSNTLPDMTFDLQHCHGKPGHSHVSLRPLVLSAAKTRVEQAE